MFKEIISNAIMHFHFSILVSVDAFGLTSNDIFKLDILLCCHIACQEVRN